jgi:hypothetical protein
MGMQVCTLKTDPPSQILESYHQQKVDHSGYAV